MFVYVFLQYLTQLESNEVLPSTQVWGVGLGSAGGWARFVVGPVVLDPGPEERFGDDKAHRRIRVFGSGKGPLQLVVSALNVVAPVVSE